MLVTKWVGNPRNPGISTPIDVARSRDLDNRVFATVIQSMEKYGGEPFVLLFDPIAFGSPTGGKEIDVVVNR